MSEHDPIARQIDDEPRFPLLARDTLAPGLVRLWAALRGRHAYKIQDIVANLVVTAGKLPYRPDADPAHVISAQQVANRMELWRTANAPKLPTNVRAVDLDLNQLEKEEQGTQAQSLTQAPETGPGGAPVVTPGSSAEVAT